MRQTAGSSASTQLRGMLHVSISWLHRRYANINIGKRRPYFHNAILRIVTELYILEAQILQRVEYWGRVVSSLVQDLKIDYDIVLHVIEIKSDDMGSCGYYLSDYMEQHVLWLRDMSTKTLQLLAVRNPTHLSTS